MKCPHCGTAFHEDFEDDRFLERNYENSKGINLYVAFCPECMKPIIKMEYGTVKCGFGNNYKIDVELSEQIYPVGNRPTELNNAIPQKYRDLFNESEQVNAISPRASATLSRYLLQMLLHEELNIKKGNLALELDELEKRTDVPSNLVYILQVFRRIANFGAHPKKSSNSNEIIEVEENESSAMLDLLLELFDFIFVKPSKHSEFKKKAEEKYGITI